MKRREFLQLAAGLPWLTLVKGAEGKLPVRHEKYQISFVGLGGIGSQIISRLASDLDGWGLNLDGAAIKYFAVDMDPDDLKQVSCCVKRIWIPVERSDKDALCLTPGDVRRTTWIRRKQLREIWSHPNDIEPNCHIVVSLSTLNGASGIGLSQIINWHVWEARSIPLAFVSKPEDMSLDAYFDSDEIKRLTRWNEIGVIPLEPDADYAQTGVMNPVAKLYANFAHQIIGWLS